MRRIGTNSDKENPIFVIKGGKVVDTLLPGESKLIECVDVFIMTKDGTLDTFHWKEIH